MALFSLTELSKGPSDCSDGSLVFKERFLETHIIKIENIKNLVGNPPEVGQAYFLWTLKSFNAFTFIPYLIKENGMINELVFSTYSISDRILDALLRYMDKGLIDQVSILISESIKFRVPRIMERLSQINLPSFHVIYGWNHSKVTLIQTKNGQYVIEGSGNFSENAQYEQYLFLNSPQVYQFRKTCIKSISHDLLSGDL